MDFLFPTYLYQQNHLPETTPPSSPPSAAGVHSAEATGQTRAAWRQKPLPPGLPPAASASPLI